MSKRGVANIPPEPMRGSQEVILQCRKKIDSPIKALVRRFLNVVMKRRKNLMEVGEGVQLKFKTNIPEGSRIGRYAYIGEGFNAPSPICVGDLAMLSTNITIVDNDHGTDNVDLPMRLDFRWEHKITVFEGDVWVGHGVILRSGVHIGRGAVIASGAIVTKDVEPYSIVGGNPARFIRKRFNEEQIQQHDMLIYGESFDGP